MEGKNEEEPVDEVETKIEETLSDDNKQKEAQHVSLPTPRLTHTHTHTEDRQTQLGEKKGICDMHNWSLGIESQRTANET